MREVYGNKGVFIMPHRETEKGYALGSVGAIISALFAVVLNFAAIPNLITVPIAISLGISWGIAAPDMLANVLGRRQQ